MESFGGGEEGGGFGGYGGMLLPLAAFVAGAAAPERVGAISQNLQFLMSQQARERENKENRAFREKEFAAHERDRLDIGETRKQQRTASELEIKQRRAQMEAGTLLPGLQFSKDVGVGSPEIPSQFADVMGEQGVMTQQGVPGWQVNAPQVQTVEELRQQIAGLKDAPPDVRAELFEKVLRSGVPVVPPQERPELQHARQALAVEEFLTPTAGAIPARRLSALVRSGESQLAPEVIRKMMNRDVVTVDLGQYVGLVDKSSGKLVGQFTKTPNAEVKVIDDPSTNQKVILFVNPATKAVERLNTSITATGTVDPNFARFMSLRTQSLTTPDMPKEIVDVTPKTAAEVLKALGVGAGGSSKIELLKSVLGGGEGLPKSQTTPEQEAAEYRRRKGLQ